MSLKEQEVEQKREELADLELEVQQALSSLNDISQHTRMQQRLNGQKGLTLDSSQVVVRSRKGRRGRK